MIISFARIKLVSIWLKWNMTKKNEKKEKRKFYFILINIIIHKYIPTYMYTYQDIWRDWIYIGIFNQYLNRFLERVSLLKISIFIFEYGKSHNIWDEIIFLILFHDNIALFIMASLPYFFVFTVLTFLRRDI